MPKEAVFRRFPRIKENLIKTYLPLCDDWLFWNASCMPIEIIGKIGSIELGYLLNDD